MLQKGIVVCPYPPLYILLYRLGNPNHFLDLATALGRNYPVVLRWIAHYEEHH